MIKHLRVFIVILLTLLIFSACSAQETIPFVKVKGVQFFIKNEPYFFVGTNIWYGANLGSLTPGGNRERLVRELDTLQAPGINNLRVMGASEGDDMTGDPPHEPQGRNSVFVTDRNTIRILKDQADQMQSLSKCK
jgi:hypothetical protein